MGSTMKTMMEERRADGLWYASSRPSLAEVEPLDLYACPGVVGRQNYCLYALLAGARNYAGIVPISEPRGLPEDCEMRRWDREAEEARKRGDPQSPDGGWWGVYEPSVEQFASPGMHHSTTYFTLEELQAFDWDAPVHFDDALSELPRQMLERRAHLHTYRDIDGPFLEWVFSFSKEEAKDLRVFFTFD